MIVLVDVECQFGDVGLQGLDGGVAAGMELGTRSVWVRWGLHVIINYYRQQIMMREGRSAGRSR